MPHKDVVCTVNGGHVYVTVSQACAWGLISVSAEDDKVLG